MKWVEEYDLILFDFDGLLVNTEHLHFQAYKAVCRSHGCEWDIDFNTYCLFAHADAKALKNEILRVFSGCGQEDFSWEELYEEKKKAYFDIIESGEIKLMPGVEKLLLHLEQKNIKRCVVTNSFRQQVEKIKQAVPTLQTIPFWITRECAPRIKPAPDLYLAALDLYARKGDKVVGFEDTIRGWNALDAAGIKGVVVSSLLHEEFQNEFTKNQVVRISSFEEIAGSNSL